MTHSQSILRDTMTVIGSEDLNDHKCTKKNTTYKTTSNKERRHVASYCFALIVRRLSYVCRSYGNQISETVVNVLIMMQAKLLHALGQARP